MAASYSAAQLLDPRAMKQQLANGSSAFPFMQSSPSRPPCEPASCSTRPDPVPNLSFDPIRNDMLTSMEDRQKAPPAPQLGTPQQLLNPKSRNSSKASGDNIHKNERPNGSLNGQPRLPTAAHHSHSVERQLESDPDQGVGNFIERLHNVSEREQPPAKKQKLDKENETDIKKKSHTSHFNKGGELGEHIKEKQKEGLQEGPGDIVDLTGDDDVEEVVVLSELISREVCYGRLDMTKVYPNKIPAPSGKAVFFSKDWPSMKVSLKRLPGKDNVIRVIDPQNNDFGTVDPRTSIGLARIMDSHTPKYRTQARLQPRKKLGHDYPGKECSDYFEMVINLYGPRSHADAIGRWLSQKQIYLRTPFAMDVGVELYNPHAPPQAKPRTNTSGRGNGVGTGGGYITRTVEEIRSDVHGVFDSLEKSRDLPEQAPDPRVVTELMSHQKQGLYFLQKQEKPRVISENEDDCNSLWRMRYAPNGVQTFYNIISGHEEKQMPAQSLSGMLSDDMGLGKTLTILSLIVSTLADAKAFGQEEPPKKDGDNVLIRNSRTTLLVAPLSTLANWEDQIGTHIKGNTLKYYVYHGGSRITDVDQLAEYDMVITTYSVVSSDFTGRSRKKSANPLFQTNFFRIVLDEAHMIREQSTRQAQAICALAAQRRWAVTGTPVQNRLEDLGSLIKFLRIRPFSDRGGFAQFILAPFKNADPDIIPKLRILVDSFTLRRLKDRIALPARCEQIVKLKFSEDEIRLYDFVAKDSRSRLQIIASEKMRSLGGKSYAHILRAIMRLRLICAHGRELLSEDDLRAIEGYSKENAIILEDENASDYGSLAFRQAYEIFMLNQESGTDNCNTCNKKLEPQDEENEHEVVGYMLPCYQLLCRDCTFSLKESLSDDVDEFKCPHCNVKVPKSFFELSKEGMEKAEEDRRQARENPHQAKVLGRYGGPHTKVKALMDSLQQSALESKALPPIEPPIKSVVFSGWTTYLDLIQIALEDNKVAFVRLDGKMSRKNRNAALEAFRDDPKVRVILISINAGGLGLNLTSGSRVYVMEPQFNPAAEAQAVDRVHRLGQTREVVINHYIMENSFEEKMLELQRRKQDLAELSMSRGKLDKTEAAKKKLDDLRSLFR